MFTQAFVMEKDSKRYPNSGGWGYALFNYEAASDKFTADPSPSDCGHACHVAEGEGPHLPPVREALNRAFTQVARRSGPPVRSAPRSTTARAAHLQVAIGRGFIAFLSALAEDERQRIVKRPNAVRMCRA